MNTSVFAGETERLSELYDYSVLDTEAEQSFDDLAKLAAYICGAPISLISLVDANRVWFKAKVGLETSEIPRIDGFCASAIQNETLFIVGDAKADAQLRAHPLVEFAPKLRFYAGAPLITPRGHRLGTLCVVDTVPRKLSNEQVEALQSLARSVVAQLEMRRTNRSYKRAQEELLGIQERITTLVEQQTKELAKNNISLMELTSQLINAQDDERRRIAREL
ncbi:MAG: GAF domain-containing protein, partial [Candidatus Acidiferrum sp.]